MGKFADKILTKGPKNGYCHICGNFSKLTRDHVPPKGCIKIGEVELRSLLGHYSETQAKPSFSQSGLNFRTICAKCNNDDLGIDYDPNLIEMANHIGRYLKAEKNINLSIPRQTNIKIKPQRVARAVVGHLLAFANPKRLHKPPASTPYHDTLREYFLNPHLQLPENIDIYFWVYPAHLHVLIDCHSVMVNFFKHLVMGSLLKFFPIAFWVVIDKPQEVSFNIPKLIENKKLSLDDETSISVNFKDIPRIQWPETPDKDGAIMSADGNSILAKKRKRNKNKLHLAR